MHSIELFLIDLLHWYNGQKVGKIGCQERIVRRIQSDSTNLQLKVLAYTTPYR